MNNNFFFFTALLLLVSHQSSYASRFEVNILPLRGGSSTQYQPEYFINPKKTTNEAELVIKTCGVSSAAVAAACTDNNHHYDDESIVTAATIVNKNKRTKNHHRQNSAFMSTTKIEEFHNRDNTKHKYDPYEGLDGIQEIKEKEMERSKQSKSANKSFAKKFQGFVEQRIRSRRTGKKQWVG